ncbi:unnamed protein product [Oikopleura dioica]|uniref:Sushi domain-containing protein n=1 Tax=Oikopleura dioica TaxID=34765 RepID=E4Z2V6_OIKDI|nr:unnamed protein product [Oikopleura dioica]
MKIFQPLSFFLAQSHFANAKTFSSLELQSSFFGGNFSEHWGKSADGVRTDSGNDEWKTCRKPEMPKFGFTSCSGGQCRTICKPGYFTIGKRDKAKCKSNGHWNFPLPDCETCAMAEIQSRPGLDSYCTIDERRGRTTCKLSCTNGSLIYGRLSRPVACKCHNKKGCEWMFTGPGMRKEDRHHVDLDKLEEICPRPPTTDPVEVVDTCPQAEKEPTCTDVTNKGTILNSWTCRDCHRVRVYFNKNNYPALRNTFDNRDSLYVKFSVRVQFDKWAHPAMRPIYLGANEYRIPFSPFKDFTDGWVDFSAEFRPLGSVEPTIERIRTCPCSYTLMSDTCEDDNDCDGVCHEGLCAECANDQDCYNGSTCKDNVCLLCEKNRDCADGLICSDENICIECESDSQCSNGGSCVRGQCQECIDDYGCAYKDQVCNDGVCVDCRYNGDCADPFTRCKKKDNTCVAA